MSQCNMDDSDCIIEEKNITCITLDDSKEGEELGSAEKKDVEEGEVSEDEKNDNIQKEAVCEIKFNSKHQYEKFGSKIIDSLKEKIIVNEPKKILKITTGEIDACIILNLNIESVSRSTSPDVSLAIGNKAETFEKELSPDLSGLSELFMIDTEPASKIESDKVPSYKRAIKDVLLDEEAAAYKKLKNEENALNMKRQNSCFNCGEADHSIRNCPRPHNAKRIKNAKRACFKTERYHLDVEQKFSHLKPGCISDKLREALGLRKGELPFFFYRMRVLGYPPGWLEEAKVEQSGITLFNSDGTKVLHSDEDEGEIDPINHKYNISKIYDFPGFNQDPGKNFFDDYKFHNVPPLSKMQMKAEFIKTLGDNVLKGYKRKKLKDFPNANIDDRKDESSIQEVTDMEIENLDNTTLGEVEFSRPPPPKVRPPSTPPPPPPTPPPICESPTNAIETEQNNFSTLSPSLMELEKQKQKLLHELESNTNINISDSINETNENAKSSEEEFSVPNNNVDTLHKSFDSPPTAHATVIKESFMGTPVLKFSPYDNLPKGDNFRAGVSDVINFENLPDSTGKYEQMKKVIKKVRTCINKLQNEE